MTLDTDTLGICSARLGKVISLESSRSRVVPGWRCGRPPLARPASMPRPSSKPQTRSALPGADCGRAVGDPGRLGQNANANGGAPFPPGVRPVDGGHPCFLRLPPLGGWGRGGAIQSAERNRLYGQTYCQRADRRCPRAAVPDIDDRAFPCWQAVPGVWRDRLTCMGRFTSVGSCGLKSPRRSNVSKVPAPS